MHQGKTPHAGQDLACITAAGVAATPAAVSPSYQADHNNGALTTHCMTPALHVMHSCTTSGRAMYVHAPVRQLQESCTAHGTSWHPIWNKTTAVPGREGHAHYFIQPHGKKSRKQGATTQTDCIPHYTLRDTSTACHCSHATHVAERCTRTRPCDCCRKAPGTHVEPTAQPDVMHLVENGMPPERHTHCTGSRMAKGVENKALPHTDCALTNTLQDIRTRCHPDQALAPQVAE